jgi:hypothetical protein
MSSDNFVSETDRRKWVRLWNGSRSSPAVFQITKPVGLEAFKLIATAERADFRALSTRGPVNPMELLFRSLFGGTRAGDEAAPAPTEWFTDEFVFTTIPRP